MEEAEEEGYLNLSHCSVKQEFQSLVSVRYSMQDYLLFEKSLSKASLDYWSLNSVEFDFLAH